MSAMKNLMIEIEELLDTTNLLCDEIAAKLNCPVSIVHDIVEHRFQELMETV